MKTDPKTILETLATLAPSIAFSVEWEPDHDPDMSIFDKGNGLEGEDPEDWGCWQPHVSASAIVNGKPVTGNAYLGGDWVRVGNDPAETNSDISGCLPQMLEEAADDLVAEIFPEECPSVAEDCAKASFYLKDVLRARYDEHRAKSSNLLGDIPHDPVSLAKAKTLGWGIKTPKGYRCERGLEVWYDDKPKGLVFFSTEEEACQAGAHEVEPFFQIVEIVAVPAS